MEINQAFHFQDAAFLETLQRHITLPKPDTTPVVTVSPLPSSKVTLQLETYNLVRFSFPDLASATAVWNQLSASEQLDHARPTNETLVLDVQIHDPFNYFIFTEKVAALGLNIDAIDTARYIPPSPVDMMPYY